jgi:hypothetical protein
MKRLVQLKYANKNLEKVKKKKYPELDMVAHSCNFSIQKAETEGSGIQKAT